MCSDYPWECEGNTDAFLIKAPICACASVYYIIYIYVHIFMVTIEGTKLQPYFVCHELFIVLGYPLSHTCNMFFLQCRSKSSQP